MDSRSPRALIDTPPVWLAGFIVLAVMQARWLPVLPFRDLAPMVWLSPTTPALWGAALIVFALLLFAAAFAEFRNRRTSIIPRETPRVLLTGGPYSISRNPIYLADAALLLGVILWGDLLSLVLLPVFLMLIERRFIRGEEATCRATFGPMWEQYAARVRRWF